MKQQSKKVKREEALQPQKTPQTARQKIQKKPTPSQNKDTSPSKMMTLPTIQAMLLIPQKDRAHRVQEYYQKIKTFIGDYLQKKIGSRVIQLMYKWATPATKANIYKIVLSRWKDLSRSKYALHTIALVAKDFDLPGVVSDLILLQNSYEGAVVVQKSIFRYEMQFRAKIKPLAEDPADLKAQETLHKLSLKSIEKGYHWFPISKLILNLSIPTMFPQEKEKVIEFLCQNVADFVNDQEGVRLFFTVINLATPKQKKSIIRQYKTYIQQIVNENNISYVTIIKLMIEVDDTVHLSQALIPQILDLLPSLPTCKKAFSIYFSLFSHRQHNYNLLGKYEKQSVSQCKKEQSLRKKEVRMHFYPPVIKCIELSLPHFLTHPIQHSLVLGVIKCLQEDKEPQYEAFITLIVHHYIQSTNSALANKEFEKCVMADHTGNKVIKNILLLQDGFIDYYCDQVANIIINNVRLFLTCKASFVLLALIEKGGREYLLDEVLKSGVKVEQIVAGEHYLKLMQDK